MTFKILMIFLILISANSCFGQDRDSASKFQHKVLDGYFICIRDSIPKTDSDVYLSRYDFLILFFKNLNDSLIESVNKLSLFSLSKPGYTLISGGTAYAIRNRIENRQYFNYLINEGLFVEADKYGIFNFDLIDLELLRSNKRFISIFKGKLNVVGPFDPNIKLENVALQELFMYLPSNINSMVYLYSILH